MSFVTQSWFHDLAALVYGGSAGWLLLYLCGQYGSVADRVALRRESASEAQSMDVARADVLYGAHPGARERPRIAR